MGIISSHTVPFWEGIQCYQYPLFSSHLRGNLWPFRHLWHGLIYSSLPSWRKSNHATGGEKATNSARAADIINALSWNAMTRATMSPKTASGIRDRHVPFLFFYSDKTRDQNREAKTHQIWFMVNHWSRNEHISFGKLLRALQLIQ